MTPSQNSESYLLNTGHSSFKLMGECHWRCDTTNDLEIISSSSFHFSYLLPAAFNPFGREGMHYYVEQRHSVFLL
uniref:Ovule protein n=1 Tax=Caenorhabditis tropicalis TaxID=1561998 RepID=A0A1I7UAJ4_9PELO